MSALIKIAFHQSRLEEIPMNSDDGERIKPT
jgi:hypothetical protein